MTQTITAADIQEAGYRPGPVFGVALRLAQQFTGVPKEETLALLAKALQYPESFLDDPVLQPLAQALVAAAAAPEDDTIPLPEKGAPYASTVQMPSKLARVPRWISP